MSEVSVNLKYGEIMKRLEDEANKICYGGGVKIETVNYPYGTMISLSYGDIHYQFNPEGYNYIYVLKQLIDNPVMDAIME